MKNKLSFLSLLLALCMLLSVFAACAKKDAGTQTPSSPTDTSVGSEAETNEAPTSGSETIPGEPASESDKAPDTESDTEAKNTETDGGDETEPSSSDLQGIYADSIIYADNIKNGVQAYYPNGVTRSDYVIENLDMTASFGLLSGKGQKLTYLKNKQGGTYLENTMDVFVRMKDGKTYFASDSYINARSNTYRIGYYYYDVRILNQSFLSIDNVENELVFDPEVFKNYSKDISKFVIKDGIINYVVNGSDPYFSCKANSINLPFEEYDAIQLTVKSTKASQAQIFMITDEVTSYSASNSITFDVKTDGEFHTYTVMLNEFTNTTGSVTGLRIDLGMERGEHIEIKDIKAVNINSDAPYILLDRTWHTYSDKVHQELHFVAPSGQTGIDTVGMITEIPADRVAKITSKAGGNIYSSIDGIDWSLLEYIGFDIKDAGIFGYIMPYDGKGGSLKVTLDGGVYKIVQEASPEGGEIKSPKEVGNTSNDFFMGLRVYTDENHDFSEFTKQAEWERNPFKGMHSDKYVGYDSLRGAYTFGIGGIDFNPPFFTSWNLHYSTEISLRNNDADRPMYFRTATTSGCLEAAALLGEGNLVLPIPLEVSKNFGEKEEPVMNYGDKTYGETVFPIVATSGIKYNIKVLNIYQNWGKFPIKQLSSIAYYAPYYHLSIGVTETTCISPWYVRGRTLWTLPDFRTLSAPYWFELPADKDYSNQPQHTSANLFEIIHYTDADGVFRASENYQNVIESSGPVYANVKMDYISDDGKMHISYEHTELPQTDELRTFYTVEIDVLDEIKIKNFKNDFAFYSWVTDRVSVGYLNANGKETESKRLEENGEYILGKLSPYFGNFGTKEVNAANIGFVIHSSDITIGGAKFDGNFVVTQTGGTRFELSLNLGETTLKAGDKMILNIILVPWGSQASTDASNLVYIRNNTCIDPFKTEVANGELISDLYMSKVRSTDGESAEFTVSGGANNATARIYGFKKLTSPKIYEKIEGKWVPYDVSSAESPDAVGNRHNYDGYTPYYDGDGTYSYAFTFSMDGVDERTFKIEAKDDFTPLPELDILDTDPINYHTDATELSALFTKAVPGISKAEVMDEDGVNFIRLWGDGNGIKEVNLNVFTPKNGVASGQYVVFKYRIPSANETSNPFQFFIGTENDSAKEADSIWLVSNRFHKDDAWHVVIIDAASYNPNGFKATPDGEYFTKYMRFDVFNTPLGESEYIDISYVGVCDSIQKLCELNEDMKSMELFSANKVESVDVATGVITLVSQSTPTVTPPKDDGVTMSKDFASFIDANNTQGYKISDVKYFGRIDVLNGFGPMGTTGVAYNSKGSNSNIGVATFQFDNTTTKDYHLAFGGWSLVYGGVEKYVWSADGGKTWQDATLYNRSTIGAAGAGMIGYADREFNKTDFNLYAANSSYQSEVKGHATCSGIAADLSAFVGQTVDVTFAVVPKADTTGLCILAHVTGVKVEAPADAEPEETSSETETQPPVEENENPYNDPINYYMDPSEIYDAFDEVELTGVGSLTLQEDNSYITFTGDGGTTGEVILTMFQNPGNVATGQYLAVKFRMPETNKTENYLQFFTSTINTRPVAADSITYSDAAKMNDGEWHVLFVDAASVLPDSVIKNGDKYFIQHVRFDVFNKAMPANESVDIAYFGIADSIDALLALPANAGFDVIPIRVSDTVKYVNTKTGEITDNADGTNNETQEPEFTMVTDASSFVDSSNAQGYKASDNPYYARFDSVNGMGPGGSTSEAFNMGSNDKNGVPSLSFNKPSTQDQKLTVAGWNLVYGGVEKYVWSADGGMTWNDTVMVGISAPLTASDAMINFCKSQYGSDVDFSAYTANSSYQANIGKANGIGADLSAYAGQTVDVTFAAVSAENTSELCILIHVKGVEVTQ